MQDAFFLRLQSDEAFLRELFAQRLDFAPGTGFRYSCGPFVLGVILERVTGTDLGSAYRTLLDFDKLGLDETYLETVERRPRAARPRAHQYLGTVDMTRHDPSFDLHGAGGHVSTLDDLARFYRALIGGRVLKPGTLETMVSGGMGIDVTEIGGEPCYGHGGFWGVTTYHCPGSRTTIATMINQADGFIPPTADLLTQRLQVHEKTAWMLRSLLK